MRWSSACCSAKCWWAICAAWDGPISNPGSAPTSASLRKSCSPPTSKPASSRPSQPALSAVVLVTGIGVATFFGVRNIIRANTVAPFNKEINTYLGNGVPPGDELNKMRSKINGKILPIHVKTREVDYVFFDLPDDLRPA